MFFRYLSRTFIEHVKIKVKGQHVSLVMVFLMILSGQLTRPGNKGRFWIISARIQPTLHMSIETEYEREFSITSGARYHLRGRFDQIKQFLKNSPRSHIFGVNGRIITKIGDARQPKVNDFQIAICIEQQI